MRWRSRSKSWKCGSCGRVVEQEEARQIVQVRHEVELERLQDEVAHNLYTLAHEEITGHLRRLVTKVVPRESETSSTSSAGCLVVPLFTAAGIWGAHVALPLADWSTQWLGGGVLGLLVGFTITAFFVGRTPSTTATTYRPGRLVEAPPREVDLLASTDPLLCHVAEKFARFEGEADELVDADEGDDDDDYDAEGPGDEDDHLEDASPADYLNLTRFGRRTRQLLSDTNVLTKAALLLPGEGETPVRVIFDDLLDLSPKFGWPLVGLCLLADRHASDSQIRQLQELVREQIGRTPRTQAKAGTPTSEG